MISAGRAKVPFSQVDEYGSTYYLFVVLGVDRAKVNTGPLTGCCCPLGQTTRK